MLKARVYERIDEVDPKRWDEPGDDPFSRHAVLAALESSGMQGVKMWYALLEDEQGRAAASLPFVRLPVDGARLTRGAFRRGIEAGRRISPSFLWTSLLACGTPLSVGNPPLRIALGADAGEVMLQAEGLLNDLADEAGAPWRVFKEFSGSELPAARVLESRGWILAPSEPNCVLPLSWRSYQAYLESLRHPYRVKILKSAARMARGGVEVTALTLSEGYDPSIHSLYEAVVDRAATQFERLTPGFFQALGRAMGDDARILLFRREGRTVGWVSLLRSGDEWHDLFHGFAEEGNREVDLYFNQLAETIRFAIDQGGRRLVLGQSTETAKSRFGSLLEPLWIGLRHRQAAVRLLLRAGAGALFPEKRITPMRVFHIPAPIAGARDARSGTEG